MTDGAPLCRLNLERGAPHRISKDVKQLHQGSGDGRSESYELTEECKCEDFGMCNGVKDDLESLVSLEEPVSSPSRVLAQRAEALVRQCPGFDILQMSPNVRENLFW